MFFDFFFNWAGTEIFSKFWKKIEIFFIVQNEFVSFKMHIIPIFDTFPKNKFYKNYLKRPGQEPVTIQEGGQPYNPCGFVTDLGPGQGPDPRTKKKN